MTDWKRIGSVQRDPDPDPDPDPGGDRRVGEAWNVRFQHMRRVNPRAVVTVYTYPVLANQADNLFLLEFKLVMSCLDLDRPGRAEVWFDLEFRESVAVFDSVSAAEQGAKRAAEHFDPGSIPWDGTPQPPEPWDV